MYDIIQLRLNREEINKIQEIRDISSRKHILILRYSKQKMS